MQVLRALLAQVAGVGLAWPVARAIPSDGPSWVVLVVAGLAACVTSRLVLRQPAWWMPVHALLPVALVLASLAPVGWLGWLAGFLVLVVIYGGTFLGDVPLFLSSPAVSAAVAELMGAHIPPGSGPRVADLGAGTGTVAVPLARRTPGLQVDAWERAPVPFLICRLRSRGLSNLRVLPRDFWRADLSQYEAVFAFLSPAVMDRLARKVRAEMRPGALFITSEFACPDWPPDETHQMADRRGTILYVHHLRTGMAPAPSPAGDSP